MGSSNAGVFFLAISLITTSALAQPAAGLSADDRTAIQALVSQYAQALSGCRSTEFADLFVPETGYFASGFRGHMVGRERLIALVESERTAWHPRATLRRPAPAERPVRR